MALRGILIDWGGVLTTPMRDAIAEWIVAERIDADHYRELMRSMIHDAYRVGGPANPIHALERGESDPAEFERSLSGRLRTLDGTAPAPEGLLRRMFAALGPEEEMYAMLRDARRDGLRTCLVSNSWGNAYPTDRFGELFDEVVISSEVGMRKPEEEIFRLALDRIRLAPADCVFIDDIQDNVEAAEALGMTGIRHREPATTIARLEELIQR